MLRRSAKKKEGCVRRKLHRMVTIVVTTVLILTGFSMFFSSSEAVAVELNGVKHNVWTSAYNVEGLLDNIGVNYKEQDYINVPLDTKITEGIVVEWKPSKKLIFSLNGKKMTKWSPANTVEEFLNNEGITFGENDRIEPEINAPLKDGLKITLEKAFDVVVNDNGLVQTFSTLRNVSVKDFLQNNGIILNELDNVTPQINEIVTQDVSVNITRVVRELVEVREEIAFDTVREDDNSLAIGTQKVVQKGQNGTLITYYELTTENGVEVTRVPVEQKTIPKVDEIVKVGTKATPAKKKPVQSAQEQIDISPTTEGKTFYVEATAYSGGGTTASGFNLSANPNAKVIAVDPRVIPLGTKVYVEGYGYAIASDTGGAIKGNIIDVYLPSESAARQWGRKKNIKITVF